jgi:hypothetical protein
MRWSSSHQAARGARGLAALSVCPPSGAPPPATQASTVTPVSARISGVAGGALRSPVSSTGSGPSRAGSASSRASVRVWTRRWSASSRSQSMQVVSRRRGPWGWSATASSATISGRRREGRRCRWTSRMGQRLSTATPTSTPAWSGEAGGRGGGGSDGAPKAACIPSRSASCAAWSVSALAQTSWRPARSGRTAARVAAISCPRARTVPAEAPQQVPGQHPHARLTAAGRPPAAPGRRRCA